jgi:hypothetical protein
MSDRKLFNVLMAAIGLWAIVDAVLIGIYC